MRSGERIIVIGAGLGGLSAALGLVQRGFSVMVMEQAASLGEVGAGLTLSSGAMQCLEALGVSAELERYSLPSANVPFVHYRTGELLRAGMRANKPRPASARVARQIHRADLHRILREALLRRAPQAIVTNWSFASYTQRGDRIEACSVDGKRVDGALLLGCDGVRSNVRSQLIGDSAVHFLGQVAFRCLVPIDAARPHLSSEGGKVFLGPGRTFNRYPLRHGALLNCVGLAQTNAWHAEGWNTPATNAEFLAQFVDWHPEVTGLIRSAPSTGIIKWALCGREPLTRWHLGSVALLGDAAHPILPFLGLGAALAIEDGVVLARALAEKSGIEAALLAYEQARQPRVDRIALASARQGELSQQRDPENYAAEASPAHDPEFFDYDPLGVAL